MRVGNSGCSKPYRSKLSFADGSASLTTSVIARQRLTLIARTRRSTVTGSTPRSSCSASIWWPIITVSGNHPNPRDVRNGSAALGTNRSPSTKRLTSVPPSWRGANWPVAASRSAILSLDASPMSSNAYPAEDSMPASSACPRWARITVRGVSASPLSFASRPSRLTARLMPAGKTSSVSAMSDQARRYSLLKVGLSCPARVGATAASTCRRSVAFPASCQSRSPRVPKTSLESSLLPSTRPATVSGKRSANRGGRPRLLVLAAQHWFGLQETGSSCVPTAIQARDRRNVASGVGSGRSSQ